MNVQQEYTSLCLKDKLNNISMYYKIENKESEVYKRLHEMRTKEHQMAKDNIEAINQKVGLEWETYLGHSGQQ